MSLVVELDFDHLRL